MAFIAPFVVGTVTGVAIKWGFDSFQGRRLNSKETEEAPVVTPDLPIVEPPHTRDELKRINGIGPVFEKRLYEAGINSFAELAALSPERIHEIINVEGTTEKMFIPESWIAQARTFAEEKVAA